LGANPLPSFVKPKKKYNPETQMKRANWTKVNIQRYIEAYGQAYRYIDIQRGI